MNDFGFDVLRIQIEQIIEFRFHAGWKIVQSAERKALGEISHVYPQTILGRTESGKNAQYQLIG